MSVVLSHNINQTILDSISDSHSGLTSSIATLGWSLGGAAVLAVTRAQGQGTVVLMEFPGLQHLLDLVLMVGSYSLQADDEKGTAQETWCSVAFAVSQPGFSPSCCPFFRTMKLRLVTSPLPLSVVAGEGEQAGALAQGQPERSSATGAGSNEGHVGESKPQ